MWRTKYLMEYNLLAVLETASERKSFIVCFSSSWQGIVMSPNCSAESALELSLQGPCSGLLPIFVIAVFIRNGSGLLLCDWLKRGVREVRRMIGGFYDHKPSVITGCFLFGTSCRLAFGHYQAEWVQNLISYTTNLRNKKSTCSSKIHKMQDARLKEIRW